MCAFGGCGAEPAQYSDSPKVTQPGRIRSRGGFARSQLGGAMFGGAGADVGGKGVLFWSG